MFKRLREDIDAIKQRDPAARSSVTVFFSYPGLHAVMFYRLAHALLGWRLRGLALVVSYLGRIITGIEIHPGATIGRRFFIDHGTGVVIGETAEIEDDVTLYQGVTLGGTSLEPGKRHPTVKQGAIVGAGAKVLGPITLGVNSRIGSNAVVLKDVADHTTVVGIPAKPVGKPARAPDAEFMAYGTPCDDLPDPVARALCGLSDEVAALRQRLSEVEGRDARPHAKPQPITAGHDGQADTDEQPRRRAV